MKKILAVSGGIDSIVMLHMFRKDPDVVVAHFDHGIRPNSAEDCLFVRRAAEKYGLAFYSKRVELGEKCSEDTARTARYAYLRNLASRLDGQIYTAHHRDDVVETMVINLLRGTGWRGIAPFWDNDIQRPLIELTKSEIHRYAAEHQLSFRQDQTNTEDAYLRNRVRQSLSREQRQQLYEIYQKQLPIRDEMEQILGQIPRRSQYSKELTGQVGMEILRQIFQNHEVFLTRPQLERALVAIQNYAPGKRFSLDKKHFLSIKRYYFQIEDITSVKIA